MFQTVRNFVKKFFKTLNWVLTPHLLPYQSVEEKIILIAIAKRISKSKARNLFYKNKNAFELFFEEFPQLNRVQEKDMMNLLTKISQINLEVEKQDYFQKPKVYHNKKQQSLIRRKKRLRTSHKQIKPK